MHVHNKSTLRVPGKTCGTFDGPPKQNAVKFLLVYAGPLSVPTEEGNSRDGETGELKGLSAQGESALIGCAQRDLGAVSTATRVSPLGIGPKVAGATL